MEQKSSLDVRRDNRTVKQFEEDIKFATKLESKCAYFICETLKKMINDVSYIDNGCDNSGELIKEYRDFSQADFLFTVKDQTFPLEIKFHSNRFSSMFFKKCNIDSYIKQNARIAVVQEEVFYYFHTDAIKYIQKHIPIIKSNNFASGKKAYEIQISELEILRKKFDKQIIKKIKWDDSVVDEIEKLFKIKQEYNKKKRERK